MIDQKQIDAAREALIAFKSVATFERFHKYTALRMFIDEVEAAMKAEPVAWQKSILRAEEHGMAIVGWEECTESEFRNLMKPTRKLYTSPLGRQAKPSSPYDEPIAWISRDKHIGIGKMESLRWRKTYSDDIPLYASPLTAKEE